MITTKQININLEKGRKLNQATTKDIDASIKVEHPKEPIKTPIVSTTNIADVADIAEKKMRDEIMVERKSFQKGDAVYKDEKSELVVKEKPDKTLEEFAEEAGGKIDSRNIPIIQKADGEKKLAMKEKMAKVRAAKEKKK